MILPANDTIRVSDVDYHTTNPASEVTPTEGMLHSVDTQVDGWYMKKYMRVDSTLYTNEIPVFPREVYLDRLRRLPNLIERAQCRALPPTPAPLGELHAGRAKLLCADL